MRKRAAFLIALLALVMPLAFCYQDTYKLYPKLEGTVIKLPPKTRHEEGFGVVVDSFVSKSSREEVQAFYDEYFASLKKVRSIDGGIKLAYWDEAENIILFHFRFTDYDDKVRFLISSDTYREMSWEAIE